MLTISNNIGQEDKLKANDKRYVVIVARIHPGETSSSYILHGLIKFLLSCDKIANLLRENLVFKIIPMINPDGAILGNNRTSFIGRDLNRSYHDPNKRLMPEIAALKELINTIVFKEKGKIMTFLDVHQHAGRKSIFMYAPYYPLHSKKYLKIRILPKLLAERSEMFRYYSCKFRMEKYK